MLLSLHLHAHAAMTSFPVHLWCTGHSRVFVDEGIGQAPPFFRILGSTWPPWQRQGWDGGNTARCQQLQLPHHSFNIV